MKKSNDGKSRQQRYNNSHPDAIAKSNANFKESYERITLNLHKVNDADIIEWLKGRDKQETIKEALRTVKSKS